MLYRIIFIAFFLVHGIISFGQSLLITTPDSLTADEKVQFAKAMNNAAFGYYQQAKTFSSKKDSINAGISLLKVDPYYLMFLGQTPDSINTFLKNHFKLTDAARREYVALFTKVYIAPRSEAYTKFKMMYDEDKSVRRLIEQCADSFTCTSAKIRLFKTDSIHAGYLYNYVKKNGWPSLSDGSQYAGVLAIHDHPHHEDYIPALKRAVLKGNVTLDILEIILQWSSGDLDRDYLRFQDTLRTHNYRRFDISRILLDQLPASLPRIEKTVEHFCNVHLYFFPESRDGKIIDEWWEKETVLWMRNNAGGGICADLTRDLSRFMCKSEKQQYVYGHGLMRITPQPAENNNFKMILYVVQGK